MFLIEFCAFLCQDLFNEFFFIVKFRSEPDGIVSMVMVWEILLWFKFFIKITQNSLNDTVWIMYQRVKDFFVATWPKQTQSMNRVLFFQLWWKKNGTISKRKYFDFQRFFICVHYKCTCVFVLNIFGWVFVYRFVSVYSFRMQCIRMRDTLCHCVWPVIVCIRMLNIWFTRALFHTRHGKRQHNNHGMVSSDSTRACCCRLMYTHAWMCVRASAWNQIFHIFMHAMLCACVLSNGGSLSLAFECVFVVPKDDSWWHHTTHMCNTIDINVFGIIGASWRKRVSRCWPENTLTFVNEKCSQTDRKIELTVFFFKWNNRRDFGQGTRAIRRMAFSLSIFMYCFIFLYCILDRRCLRIKGKQIVCTYKIQSRSYLLHIPIMNSISIFPFFFVAFPKPHFDVQFIHLYFLYCCCCCSFRMNAQLSARVYIFLWNFYLGLWMDIYQYNTVVQSNRILYKMFNENIESSYEPESHFQINNTNVQNVCRSLSIVFISKSFVYLFVTYCMVAFFCSFKPNISDSLTTLHYNDVNFYLRLDSADLEYHTHVTWNKLTKTKKSQQQKKMHVQCINPLNNKTVVQLFFLL